MGKCVLENMTIIEGVTYLKNVFQKIIYFRRFFLKFYKKNRFSKRYILNKNLIFYLFSFYSSFLNFILWKIASFFFKKIIIILLRNPILFNFEVLYYKNFVFKKEKKEYAWIM